MPEEKKQDIPLDLQAYQARNPGAFPNPEAFQTAWFDEGYGSCEGLVTFIESAVKPRLLGLGI